jgi:alkylation response protein AidB-like acyl-CoA dehydrogenase
MVTFSFERGTAWIGEAVESRRMLVDVVRLAAATPAPGGGTLWDNAALRRDAGLLAAELRGLWALIRRNVSDAGAGTVPVRGASVFKLAFTENRQHLDELAASVLGRAGLTMTEDLVEDRVNKLSYSIAAGTSQIQKNILAERVLGLPREPR